MEINFKDFKDKITERLYQKVGERLEEIRKEFAQAVFEEKTLQHNFLGLDDHKILNREKDSYGAAYSLGLKHGYHGYKKLGKKQTKEIWPEDHEGHHDNYLDAYKAGKEKYKDSM